MAAPAIGERLGKYLIEAELGRGGMGIVYRARHVSLDRTVALKIVLSGLTPDAEDLKRFQREAQAIARLNHPNIVQVFDIEESHELTYLVMEFVAGENLDGLLKRTSISWKRMTRIAADIAGALHFAHTKGVLHRDIKPANVLLSEDRQVKVADFGLAYLLDTEKGYTKTGILVGSPHYMSPEQCQGKKLDGRSDLYSLGVVLFRMLTGRLPFQAASSIHVLMKQISDPAPDPKELAPEIPEALAAITRRAMQKKPEDRFADMRAMRNALLEVLGEPPDDVRPSLETSPSVATTSPMLSSPDSGATEVVTGGITLDVAPRSTTARQEPVAVGRPPEPVSTPAAPATGVGEGTEFVSGLMALGIGPTPPTARTERQQPPTEPVRPREPERAPAPAAPREPEAQPTPRKVAPQPRRVTPPPASSRPSRNLLPWLLTIPIAIGAGVLGSKYVLTGGKTAEPVATPSGESPAPAPSPPSTGAAASPGQAPVPTTVPEALATPAVTPIATAASVEIATPAPGPTAPAGTLPAIPTVPAVAPTAPVATPPAAAPTSPPRPAASPRSMEQTVELPFQGDRKRQAAGTNAFCFTESAQRYTFPAQGKNPDAASIRMQYEIEPAEPVVGDRVVVRALVANGSGTDFLVDRFEESDPSGATPPAGFALMKSVPPGQTLELRRYPVELKSASDVRRSLKVFDGQQGVWTRSFQLAPCR